MKLTYEDYQNIESGLQCLKCLAKYAHDFAHGTNQDLTDAAEEDLGSFTDCWVMGTQSMDEVLALLKSAMARTWLRWSR